MQKPIGVAYQTTIKGKVLYHVIAQAEDYDYILDCVGIWDWDSKFHPTRERSLVKYSGADLDIRLYPQRGDK